MKPTLASQPLAFRLDYSHPHVCTLEEARWQRDAMKTWVCVCFLSLIIGFSSSSLQVGSKRRLRYRSRTLSSSSTTLTPPKSTTLRWSRSAEGSRANPCRPHMKVSQILRSKNWIDAPDQLGLFSHCRRYVV